jgi:transposase
MILTHPARERLPERFVLYLDRARYYGSPVVKDWLRRHPEFELEPLPTYSPNLNLIERLWKLLRKRALSRWHKTSEAMQAAVSEVLDHLSDHRKELDTLMTERFPIVAKAALTGGIPGGSLIPTAVDPVWFGEGAGPVVSSFRGAAARRREDPRKKAGTPSRARGRWPGKAPGE